MSSNNSGRSSDMAQCQKQPPHQGQWSTGLFDCLEDRSNCTNSLPRELFTYGIFTCFCPCMTFGRIAEIVDRGTTSCAVAGTIYHFLGAVGCGWLYAGSYRTKMRGLFSLPAAPCHDFLVHSFCCVCSLCQEYRELKIHGIDPTIGWQANVEKWNREGVKPPMVEPAMAR